MTSYHARVAATPHKDGRAGLRVKALIEAAQAIAGEGNRVTATHPNGSTFEWERVERDGTLAVRVYPVGGTPQGDAYVTIVNPPLLVSDPNGDIEIDGKRYREDPLTALAQVMANVTSAHQQEAPPWR